MTKQGHVSADAKKVDEFNADAGVSYHIVVQVEFNGRNPGGTYYDRLHKMGVWVNQGNRDEFKSALHRRHNSGNNPQALVLQEGMFSCENEDVARRIANIADEAGAEMVTIGRYYSTVYRVNDNDLTAYENYKKGTGKRGPKKEGDKGTYTLTCFQEVRSYEVALDAFPMVCGCGSMHFQCHQGEGKHYVKPDWSQETNVFDYWQRSRFDTQGIFEIPLRGVKGKKMHPQANLHPVTLPKLDIPIELQEAMNNDPDFACHVWDTLYCMTRFTEAERFKERLNVIMVYSYSGGNKPLFMGVPTDGYDLVDLAVLDKDLMQFI